jgi:hypothetical protein
MYFFLSGRNQVLVAKTYGNFGEHVEQQRQHGQVDPDPLAAEPEPGVSSHVNHIRPNVNCVRRTT